MRGLGNFLRRLVALRRIVFRCLANDDTRGETADDGEGQSEPVFNAQQIENDEGGDGNERGTDVCAKRQRAKQVFHGCPFLRAHQIDADERKEYADCSNNHRSNDGAKLHVAV